MAAEKTDIIEREYVIPLRKSFIKAPQYERAKRAIRTIKRFIARHMKVEERDFKKIKLDIFLNNELWFKGRRKPPAKIKVRATKEKGIVKVNFASIPEHVKFIKSKIEKQHKKSEKKEEKPSERQEPGSVVLDRHQDAKQDSKSILRSKEEKKEDEEKKKDEKEKGQAVAEQFNKQALQETKAQKHLTAKKDPSFHRMALKK